MATSVRSSGFCSVRCCIYVRSVRRVVIPIGLDLECLLRCARMEGEALLAMARLTRASSANFGASALAYLTSSTKRQGCRCSRRLPACDTLICPGPKSLSHHPAFAFSSAAVMPATAQASSLSEVSPETPTAPSSVVPSWISTPPGTGTSAPLAIVFTASMK